MSRRARTARILVAVAGAALMAACASSPAERAGLRGPQPAQEPTPGPTSSAPLTPMRGQGSLYGLFLAGEAALEKGSSRDAAFYLGRASELAPDAGFLKERAFTAALIAGDIEKASALAPQPGEGTAPTQRLGYLAKAVDLLARGKGQDAAAILNTAPAEGQTGAAIQLLRPWAAAAAGDWFTATAPVTVQNPLVQLFGGLGRARLLERSGRTKEAEAAYKALAVDPNNTMFASAYGAFLERRGRRAEAVSVYEESLAASRDTALEQARARARSGRSAPPQPSLQEGAAEALLAPAASLISRRQAEVGLALLRLALRLDPGHDEAWMLVGDAMASAGDVTSSREAYGRVRASSPEYAAAQSRLAWSLQRAGDVEGALKLARATMDRSRDDVQALSAYADLLRENARYDEAITVLDKLVQRNGAGSDAWRLHFLRGVAHERSGRWDRAEMDLRQALKLRPEEPEVMNYLAFGWADRGANLTEALDMLQKAVMLRPRSGEIKNSLGWARYRLGQYGEAVRDLERAAQMTPYDPSVNDHLGDAYWRVGRKLEAEFQWRRVLTLDPTPTLRAQVEGKIARGLDDAGRSALASAGAGAAQP